MSVKNLFIINPKAGKGARRLIFSVGSSPFRTAQKSTVKFMSQKVRVTPFHFFGGISGGMIMSGSLRAVGTERFQRL